MLAEDAAAARKKSEVAVDTGVLRRQDSSRLAPGRRQERRGGQDARTLRLSLQAVQQRIGIRMPNAVESVHATFDHEFNMEALEYWLGQARSKLLEGDEGHPTPTRSGIHFDLSRVRFVQIARCAALRPDVELDRRISD